ncbi:MAG: hypothetical protein QN720_04510 [Nitrososphaeraceae archaeon]|nr:hypothetical protein [Nitrososphaeraceae archaeon]
MNVRFDSRYIDQGYDFTIWVWVYSTGGHRGVVMVTVKALSLLGRFYCPKGKISSTKVRLDRSDPLNSFNPPV